MIGGVLVDLPVEGYSLEFCPSKGVLVVVLGPSLCGLLSTFLYVRVGVLVPPSLVVYFPFGVLVVRRAGVVV